MPQNDADNDPLRVMAFEGCVILEGTSRPIAVALTPEAALETAVRIVEAARTAMRCRPPADC